MMPLYKTSPQIPMANMIVAMKKVFTALVEGGSEIALSSQKKSPSENALEVSSEKRPNLMEALLQLREFKEFSNYIFTSSYDNE
jgi:hypothetical protein